MLASRADVFRGSSHFGQERVTNPLECLHGRLLKCAICKVLMASNITTLTLYFGINVVV